MKVSEETKNYVTPYAFGVSDALIGKALASPLRRMWAILIDLIIVGSLTLMSIGMFAIVSLVVSVVGYFKAKARKTGSMAQTTFVITAIISVFVISASFFIGEDEVDANLDSKETVSQEVAESENTEEASEKPEEKRVSYSLVTYVKGLLSDLGLGFGWAMLYFSVFTAWFNGQTVGKMMLRTKVVKIDSKPLSFWESFERYGGYSAGFATGLLGFMQIYWDPNRQAIHDKISETVVLDLRKPDKADLTL